MDRSSEDARGARLIRSSRRPVSHTVNPGATVARSDPVKHKPLTHGCPFRFRRSVTSRPDVWLHAAIYSDMWWLSCRRHGTFRNLKGRALTHPRGAVAGRDVLG